MRLTWFCSLIMCAFSVLFAVLCTIYALSYGLSLRNSPTPGVLYTAPVNPGSVTAMREAVDQYLLTVVALAGTVVGAVWACFWAIMAWGSYNRMRAQENRNEIMRALGRI
jgi:hypothetical protein